MYMETTQCVSVHRNGSEKRQTETTLCIKCGSLQGRKNYWEGRFLDFVYLILYYLNFLPDKFIYFLHL